MRNAIRKALFRAYDIVAVTVAVAVPMAVIFVFWTCITIAIMLSVRIASWVINAVFGQ